MKELQKHLKSGRGGEKGFESLRLPCKKIVCRDGFTVSVQASSTHYCWPRDNDGPYCEVELGYPSEPVEAWMDYAERAEKPCDTVYGYVPIAVVESVIEQHGGIDWNKTKGEV